MQSKFEAMENGEFVTFVILFFPPAPSILPIPSPEPGPGLLVKIYANYPRFMAPHL